MAELTFGAATVAVGTESLKDYVNQHSLVPSTPNDDGKEAHMSEMTCVVDAVARDNEDLEDCEQISIHSDDKNETHMEEVTSVADTVAVHMEAFKDCEQTSIPTNNGKQTNMAEATCAVDTIAVDTEDFEDCEQISNSSEDGEESHMEEATCVVDTVAVETEGFEDCEQISTPFGDREESHMAEATCAVDMEGFEDCEQMSTPFDERKEAHMAVVSCVVDTVAVDMEGFEDCEQISTPFGDREESHTAEATCAVDTVAVDMEGFEDCEQISIPFDDIEEAHMAEVGCAVDIEGFEDCEQISIPSDDEEEVRIPVNPDWVSLIIQRSLHEPTRLKASLGCISCSIHRVPSWLCDYNKIACQPQIISIGPFHYEKRKDLQVMEEHKWRYLRDICSRESEGWLEDCLATVKGLEKRARNYYSEVIPLTSDSFVEMMVLDGCFIIELFRRFWIKDYNDVIFRLAYRKKALSFDLLLLENQIPFFILQRLFALMKHSRSFPLLESALKFFFPDYKSVADRVNNSKVRVRHLLHLVHTSYDLFRGDNTEPCEIPTIPCASRLKEFGIWFKKRDVSDADIPTIPCASRLKELGIRFKKRDVSDADFLDIKFHKGVIEIPTIEVWDKTQIEFFNLIAFEQCYDKCKKYITTYIIFMDWLINTAPDVEILRRKGIIIDYLHNDKLVASHFNCMAKEAIMHYDDFYLSGVCKKINEYSKKTAPKLGASLQSYLHDYFKNPWSLISFLAALILLCLTIIQTFFTSFPKFAVGN